MPTHLTHIRAFLRQVEGPCQTRGYIPCHLVGGGSADYRGGPGPERYLPMGISGVTVGTGVDLGQVDAPGLCRMGVNEGTLTLLTPYLGLRGAQAVAALHRQPVSIPLEMAEALDTALHTHHGALIAARYDADVPQAAFGELPWQAQAVIFSLLYQRGAGSPRHFPHTWTALVTGRWAEASARLCQRSLWAAYQNRRWQEGQRLRDLFSEKKEDKLL